MKTDVRSWVTLAYLALVLLLGGASSAGLGANVLLQVCGAALIALVLWQEKPSDGTVTGLRAFLFALLGMAVIQFLPLPPLLWANLPGRDEVSKGYDLAGVARPWLSLSLNPWRSLQSLVWWIPALAIFVAAGSASAPRARHMVGLIAAVAYASVVLAMVQAYSGSGYFYAITNRGNGVGLFANSNHFGAFMLIALVLVAGLWIQDRQGIIRLTPKMASGYVLMARLAPLIVGVFLSNSLACAILLVPVLAGIFLLFRPQTRINWPLVGLTTTLCAVGLVWLLSSGLVSNDLMAKSGTIGIGRGEFLANGIVMAKTLAPLGSGIGTFIELYPWFEDPATVGTTFVNHAHNDLLELVIETGLLGLAVLAIFFRWFAATAWKLWNSNRERSSVALAATLGIAAVLLHSLADYPLRTAAISCLFALCMVLIKRPPEGIGENSAALHPARTVKMIQI